MLLTISSNGVNPQTIDLSNEIRVSQGEGMDTYNPSYSQRVFSHSLLKEGGVLALEDRKLREMTFPLRLKSVSSTGVAQRAALLNQIINTPGATATWQDDGMSQPTTFDLASGQFDIQYNFREQQQFYISGNLRLFVQPFGRTAGPRAYAAASGVGPLLMISPYASGGAQTIAASTQAGVAGWGGQQQPSGGVFYWGNPSLAGDAPALLQVSYVGPLPTGATWTAQTPRVAVSILPDQYYQPIIPVNTWLDRSGLINDSTAIGSQYASFTWHNQSTVWSFNVPVGSPGIEPTGDWAGSHRLFLVARASNAPVQLYTTPNVLVGTGTGATIYPTPGWALYDLGTFTLRPSEYPLPRLWLTQPAQTASVTVDINAAIVLPDSRTWYFNGAAILGSQYGWPSTTAGVPVAPYTNTVLLDDTLGDQFIYAGPSQTYAPSAAGMVPSSARITQFSRGAVPRPEPRSGLPIIAILGMNTGYEPSSAGQVITLASSAWSNPQNLRTMAQVNVLERSRYVLP